MATLQTIKRVTIILDLIKDGEVTLATPYNAIEAVPNQVAAKYAQAFWTNSGRTLTDEAGQPRQPNNNELLTHYINVLRGFHQDQLAATRVSVAAQSASQDERRLVETEAKAEIGQDE